MLRKPIIVVDIDDVLSASAVGFARHSNATWGCNITADDYNEDWAIPWGVTRRVAEERAIAYHASGVIGRHDPFADAQAALKEIAAKYDLIAATSRRTSVKPETDAWLSEHFAGLFKEVVYVGMWDRDKKMDFTARLNANKTDVCLAYNAQFIIDDQLKHCLAAAAAGVAAILFGDYPWNRTDDILHHNIVRAHDWAAVRSHLNG